MNNSAALNTLFAPALFLDGRTLLTKDGNIGCFYRVQGIDFETASDDVRDDAAGRLHTALRLLDFDFRVYQYVFKRRGADDTAYHRANAVYTIESYWAIFYEPNKLTDKWKRLQVNQKKLEQQRRYLKSKVGSFEKQAGGLLGMTPLEAPDIFQLLRRLAALDHEQAAEETLRYRDNVDYWMGSAAISCYRDDIVLSKPATVMSMRSLPRQTYPAVLNDLLRMDAEFVLCTEFKPVHIEEANKRINAGQKHFKGAEIVKDLVSALQMAMNGGKEDHIVKDASASADIDELSETLIALNNAGEFLGEFSYTMVFTGASWAALEAPTAEAAKIVGNAQGSLLREGPNSLDAYLSIIPGNGKKNLRRLQITSANYSHLSLIWLPSPGEKTNAHLGAECLTTLETSYKTLYPFNLHEGDLLGALLFGIMGSGKSFLTNLLIDSSQKYNPFTFILDVGGSYNYLTKKHGGSYLHLSQRNEGFSINPFALEKNAKNLDFLSAFVHVLLGTAGYLVTPSDSKAIDRAVRTANRLSGLDLPPTLAECLYNWTGDGRYAYLFDNDLDTLEIASFQTFDLQGVSDKVIEPLFFYLFNRISQVVYSPANVGRPKQLFSDEAWKFLATPAARNYFIEAGKTWRKHNGGLCLITQSALDLERAGLLDCINEICPTKILLANPGARKSFYQQTFELNDREVELFSHLIPKQQFLLKTPLKSAVLNVHVDPRASWEYRNDPFSNAKRDKFIAEHGYERGLDLLAESA